jgi:hypothetical protein
MYNNRFIVYIFLKIELKIIMTGEILFGVSVDLVLKKILLILSLNYLKNMITLILYEDYFFKNILIE